MAYSYKSHGSDIPNIYGPGELTDALINFATNLDPNGKTLIHWPAYTNIERALFTLLDGEITQEITDDTFRVEGMRTLTQAMLADPY